MNQKALATVLESVFDPELGLDIVSLGLVYGIRVDEHAIVLEMSLTSPECPMGELLATMAASRLARAGAGRDVSIEIVAEPPWNPAMMDGDARTALGIPD